MAVLNTFGALLAVFSSLAVAQRGDGDFHPCNPLKNGTGVCKPNIGLPESSYSVDFTKQKSLPKDWTQANYETVNYGSKGAEFTFNKRGAASQIWTDFYILFGSVETVMQVAPGVGIISSSVLLSDDFDEIDWEFSGNNFGNNGSTGMGQNNWFGKGITGTYDRGQYFNVSDPQGQFHTYRVDWSPQSIVWSIDGRTIRTLLEKDCNDYTHQFPQTPSKIQIGLWDGGDPSTGSGTYDWAGGITDIQHLEKHPVTFYVKSVRITNANPAHGYNYTNESGKWKSIQIIKKPLHDTKSQHSNHTGKHHHHVKLGHHHRNHSSHDHHGKSGHDEKHHHGKSSPEGKHHHDKSGHGEKHHHGKSGHEEKHHGGKHYHTKSGHEGKHQNKSGHGEKHNHHDKSAHKGKHSHGRSGHENKHHHSTTDTGKHHAEHHKGHPEHHREHKGHPHHKSAHEHTHHKYLPERHHHKSGHSHPHHSKSAHERHSHKSEHSHLRHHKSAHHDRLGHHKSAHTHSVEHEDKQHSKGHGHKIPTHPHHKSHHHEELHHHTSPTHTHKSHHKSHHHGHHSSPTHIHKHEHSRHKSKHHRHKSHNDRKHRKHRKHRHHSKHPEQTQYQPDYAEYGPPGGYFDWKQGPPGPEPYGF